ncbi:MAG TPA: hypothetical protein PKK99_07650, partial [Bacteroidia bacterium]|nr:hypothetical protein [Bacteroidia bacterium]
MLPLLLQAQSPAPSSRVLSDPADQNTLNTYRSKAENYLLKNLNRFGLEQLQAYDRVLDTLFEKEKKDTLDLMEKNFQKESSDRKNLLAAEQKHISELTSSKDTSLERYHGLLRKAAIAFAAWIILVLILMQF